MHWFAARGDALRVCLFTFPMFCKTGSAFSCSGAARRAHDADALRVSLREGRLISTR